MSKHFKLSAVTTALLLAGLAGTANAAGIGVFSQGVKQLGNAYAGTAASAEDTATIAYNPAGLMRLQGQQASIGSHAVFARSDYDISVTRDLDGAEIGSDRGSLSASSAIPHLYYSQRLSDNSAFGLGIYVPFGSAAEYDADWPGRYHGIASDIKTVNFNPVFAFNATDRISVGLGAIVQYMSAELTNEIDVGYLLARRIAQQPGTDPADEQAYLDALAHQFDVYNQIKGDDISYAFNFGLLWEPVDGVRLGLNYRSKVEHVLDGRARRPQTSDQGYIDNLTEVLAVDLGLPNAEELIGLALGPAGAAGGDVESQITLPEVISIGLYQDLTPQWALLAGATYTRWSHLDEIRISFPDASDAGGDFGDLQGLNRRDLVQPLRWQSTWQYSIGATYRYDAQWTFRAGIGYDESPVRGTETRTVRLPDNDRTWLALGAGYAVSDTLSIDGGYMYVRVKDGRLRDVENPSLANHLAEGKYSDVHAHLLGLQLNYTF